MRGDSADPPLRLVVNLAFILGGGVGVTVRVALISPELYLLIVPHAEPPS